MTLKVTGKASSELVKRGEGQRTLMLPELDGMSALGCGFCDFGSQELDGRQK